MPTVRAMFVSPDVTLLDAGQTFKTPDGGLDDLAVFLGRVSQVAHPHGMTVLLDRAALPALGLPVQPPKALTDDHPALHTARSTGWKVSELSPWMTFYRADRPTIHLGLTPWLTQRTFAFWHEIAHQAVPVLYRWHRLTQVPYHGSNGGLASLTLMRDHHSGKPPMWKPRNWDQIEPATSATEVHPDWEQHEPLAAPHRHMLDAHTQYLTAAGQLPLAVGELVHRRAPIGPYPVPGYYQVVTPPWFLSHVLPHPIGNCPQVGEPRWITAPTLALLRELAEHYQVLDEPEILDSWVAGPSKDGKKEFHSGIVLKNWSQRIRESLKNAQASQDDMLIGAVKSLYKHGVGMLERPRGRVYRPDWAHAIIGSARSNQWRKIYDTYRNDSGRAPVKVEYDQVWYTSLNDDITTDWPSGFTYGAQPGGYTVKASSQKDT